MSFSALRLINLSCRPPRCSRCFVNKLRILNASYYLPIYRSDLHHFRRDMEEKYHVFVHLILHRHCFIMFFFPSGPYLVSLYLLRTCLPIIRAGALTINSLIFTLLVEVFTLFVNLQWLSFFHRTKVWQSTTESEFRLPLSPLWYPDSLLT